LRSSPLGFCGKPRRQPTLIEMDHVKIYEDGQNNYRAFRTRNSCGPEIRELRCKHLNCIRLAAASFYLTILQDLSGLYSVICRARSKVFSPKSF
jgi:hypothetical protein